EAAYRNQAFAIAEHHIHELDDLLGVRLVAEHVDLARRIVEVTPRIEVDDLAGGGLFGGSRRIVVFVAHADNPQQRSAHGQKRHSKKSRVVAMRGSSSPVSV